MQKTVDFIVKNDYNINYGIFWMIFFYSLLFCILHKNCDKERLRKFPMINFEHKSVLLSEAIDSLNISPDGIYVDGTAGGGGHSKEILKRLSPKGKLICFDKDPDAICHIRNIFKNFNNVEIVNSDFRNIFSKLEEMNIKKIKGVLLDLGVSSHQIDKPERGFCYSQNAFLDMRMSQSGFSAYDLVNTFELEKLVKIIFEYGEERFGRKIAKKIVEAREKKPIETTFELCEIIKSAVFVSKNTQRGNPCKRTFQAIRIAVNDELASLSECIDKTFEKLEIGGRFCIITFHSLEDRIVKQKFSKLARGCECPPEFPICVCGKTPVAKLVNKKPVLPTNDEIFVNKRAKSAKLRALEKIK